MNPKCFSWLTRILLCAALTALLSCSKTESSTASGSSTGPFDADDTNSGDDDADDDS